MRRRVVVVLRLLTICLLLQGSCLLADDWVYTVRPGDNLWNLAERHLKSFKYIRQLQLLNGVQDPYHIPPGKKFVFRWNGLSGNPPARALPVSMAMQWSNVVILREFCRQSLICSFLSVMKSRVERIVLSLSSLPMAHAYGFRRIAAYVCMI